MKIRLFQVDAFTDKIFGGNPAAVCPLDQWLSDGVMQLIAMENNQAETAFFVRNQNGFHIRWFTPTMEVDLCGHATLAAAHVLFELNDFPGQTVEFSSRSGLLTVTKEDEFLTLDFPADPPEKITPPDYLITAVGSWPIEAHKGKSDYVLVYGTAEEIKDIVPDMRLVARVPARGVIVTAPGKDIDFVSRFFAPQSGIPEDPVTGSAHTTLAPYWAARLGRTTLSARQLSKRGGRLRCILDGERVKISGQACVYMTGEIQLPVASLQSPVMPD
jgi:PhzF family phenazine biosynthesis protein